MAMFIATQLDAAKQPTSKKPQMGLGLKTQLLPLSVCLVGNEIALFLLVQEGRCHLRMTNGRPPPDVYQSAVGGTT